MRGVGLLLLASLPAFGQSPAYTQPASVLNSAGQRLTSPAYTQEVGDLNMLGTPMNSSAYAAGSGFVPAVQDSSINGAPTLTNVTPASGSTLGGTVVTITGTDFTGVTAVSFGGTPATSFTFNSATQITATTPVHAAGAVSVDVTTPGGTNVANTLFTYVALPTVASASPSVAGSGSNVTITGTGFTGATSVTIGGVEVTSFTVVNDTTITTTVPAGVNGLVNVVVTTGSGTGTGTGVLSVVDYLVTSVAGVITCTDASGNSDTLTVVNQNPGSTIKFSAPGRTFSVNGAAATVGDSGASGLSRVGATSITIDAGAGNDTVSIGGFGGMPSLTVNGGTGDDTVNFTNNIVFAAAASVDVDLQNDDAAPGSDRILFATNATLTCATGATGSFTFKCSRNIQLDPGVNIVIGSGTLTLEANQQTTPSTGDFAGIYADGAILTTEGSGGAIILKGRGGDAGAAAVSPNAGIHLLGNTAVTSGGPSANGEVTLEGTSGTGGDFAGGVRLEDSSIDVYNDSDLSSGVTITGTAEGTVDGIQQCGIFVGGVIGTYINAHDSAPVTLVGTGAPAPSGSGSDGNVGVQIESFSAVSSEGGDISITGTGGQGTGATVGGDYHGIKIYGDVAGATIALTGTAGVTSTDNHGIVISGESHGLGTAAVTSVNGIVTLTGSTTSDGGYGLWLDSSGGYAVESLSGNDVTLVADKMELRDTGGSDQPVLNLANTPLTLKPLTPTRGVDLGGADSPFALGLTQNELFLISNDGDLQIGDVDNGNGTITISDEIDTVIAPFSRPSQILLTSHDEIIFTNGRLLTDAFVSLDTSLGSGAIRPHTAGIDVIAGGGGRRSQWSARHQHRRPHRGYPVSAAQHRRGGLAQLPPSRTHGQLRPRTG